MLKRIKTHKITEDSISLEDTGWKTLTLSDGYEAITGKTPQIRKINNKVYIRGQVKFTVLEPYSGMIVARLPYKPKIATYKHAATQYFKIARIGVSEGGPSLFVDWIWDLQNSKPYTGELLWLDLNIEYETI